MDFDIWSFIIGVGVGVVVGAVALGLLLWFVIAKEILVDKEDCDRM